MTACSLLRLFLLRIRYLATQRWITDEVPKQIKGKEEVVDTLLTKWKFCYDYLLYNCPRRVLAQTAKTRGGILEVPAY